MLPDKKTLECIVKELQKIMRIQDWDIELKIKNDEGMCAVSGINNALGYCSRQRDRKLAYVYLNSEREAHNWYTTLVHEMYHVVTDDFILVVDSLNSDYIPEEYQKSVHENTSLQYERLINQLAAMFNTVYPVTKFLKEGDCHEEKG